MTRELRARAKDWRRARPGAAAAIPGDSRLAGSPPLLGWALSSQPRDAPVRLLAAGLLGTQKRLLSRSTDAGRVDAGARVSAWLVGTPFSRRPREKPPDLKINSASGVISPFPQSHSNPESNLVFGPGGDACVGPQFETYTRPPHAAAFFHLQKKEKKICNKRQSRVRLGAFIPRRKDRCAHCPARGSYGRVSAEPQPQLIRNLILKTLLYMRRSAEPLEST
ncbi:PREDICTED: uncharacterized protein LOC105502257 [Colobus angolensis palliatus]|uniref:uncharacterized protein LOC105502257 n=1 Tax=Colobus angolensis palliatus TaxID=336983 RepID=UPI0005F56A5E|nr:PREDICTED: uncharacterized protein LOC105502257 [Colobus angolensis palliatus]